MNNNTIIIPNNHTDSTSGSTLISGEYYKGLCLAFTVIGLILQSFITFLAIRKKLISCLTLSTTLIWTSYIPLLISQCLDDISPGFQVAHYILFGFGSLSYLSTQWLQLTKSLDYTNKLKHFLWVLIIATISFFIIFLILPCLLILFTTPTLPILNLASIWTLTFLIQTSLLTLTRSTRVYVYVNLAVLVGGYGMVMVGLSLYGTFESRGIFINTVILLIPGIFVDEVMERRVKNVGFKSGVDERRDSYSSFGSEVYAHYR